jgi:uncharacterized membrane protein
MIRSVKAIVPATLVVGTFAGCGGLEPVTLPDTGITGSSAVPNPKAESQYTTAQNTSFYSNQSSSTASSSKTTTTAAAAGGTTAAATNNRSSSSSSDQGRQHASFAIPTGRQDTSVLLVERDLPNQIVNGQDFSYDIKVTNISQSDAKEVTVRDDCAGPLTVVSMDPQSTSASEPFVWNLGDLKPGESRTIHVVGKTTGTEPFTSCASATYNSTLCLTAPIVSPALQLTLSAPSEATPCDNIPLKLTVTNTGTGTAHDVHLAYPLPEGWKSADGKSSADFTVDALEPNQSKDFTFNATAPKEGEYSYKATAAGAQGLKAESSAATTMIRQPMLSVKADAPERSYIGAPLTIKYTITNEGNGVANSPTLEVPLPQGAKFTSATDGGTMQSGVASWKLDPIAPQASKTVSMILQPDAIGGIQSAATAKANCAAPASTGPINVAVFGIPAMTIEVTDLVDPVPVGGETTYQIIVTNQGSATDTNVKVVATLEDTEQFLSASGGTAKTTDHTVEFDPIASIAPKASVTLKVVVKCLTPSDTRFRVSMTSDQLSRPVDESESTHIYK